MATATTFWATLQQKHERHLASLEPVYVTPDVAGGKLYHLRVGPLSASKAEKLCMTLKERGADCFCVTAAGEKMEPREMTFPAPS